MTKPVRGTYRIRVGSGSDAAEGWILGGYAAARSRWFWKFTDLRTGLGVCGGLSIEGKAAAMEHLAKLAAGGGMQPWEMALLAAQPDLVEAVAS